MTPAEPNQFPTWLRKVAYHGGSPEAMPVIELDTDVAMRLAGSRKSAADKIQNPDHTANGVTTPPTPRAAAEDATPSSISSFSPSERVHGQAINPINPYMKTDPGAPLEHARRTSEQPAQTLSEEPDPEDPEEGGHRVRGAR